MAENSMRQLINMVDTAAPLSPSSVILRDLIVEARRLTKQLELLERVDYRAALLVRARISGRLDEAGFGDMMRGLGKGAKKVAGGVMRGTQASKT
jgi:hypothetical protein